MRQDKKEKQKSGGKSSEKSAARHFPFWLQIVCILLAGVLASVGIWIYGQARQRAQNAEAEASEDTQAEYTVTFANEDGTVIEQKAVLYGKGVLPPEINEPSQVFRGWSAAINTVTADVEVHPQFYSIVEDNLFYVNTTYVVEGEQFTLPLMLGGNVHISSAELEIQYDPEVMDFVEAEETLGKVELKEPGTLIVTLDSNTAITETTELAELTFLSKKKEVYSTEIALNGSNAAELVNGKAEPVDIATINNLVYYLQEVSSN